MDYNSIKLELDAVYLSEGNIIVKAYYKMKKGVKIYYDFQFVNNEKLKGSFDLIYIQELIYYIVEQ